MVPTLVIGYIDMPASYVTALIGSILQLSFRMEGQGITQDDYTINNYMYLFVDFHIEDSNLFICRSLDTCILCNEHHDILFVITYIYTHIYLQTVCV